MLLLLGVATQAQLTTYPSLVAGYTYQNQSFGELGARLIMLNNDDVVYRASATAMMGSTQGEFTVMPKVQADVLLNFQKNVDIFHSWYFLAGVETTSKYFSPKVGFSLFGILDVTGGYAFSYGSLLHGKELKGFNFNLGLSIPLVFFAK